jgi:hypothetical protein
VDAIEFCKATHDAINDSIKFADAKAATVLGSVSFVVGAGAAAFPSFLTKASAQGPVATDLCLGFAVLFLGPAVLVLYNALAALAPSIADAKGSLISFQTLTGISVEEYTGRLNDPAGAISVAEFARLNIALAGVAATKFKRIRRAVHWMQVAVLTALGLGASYALLSISYPLLFTKH